LHHFGARAINWRCYVLVAFACAPIWVNNGENQHGSDRSAVAVTLALSGNLMGAASVVRLPLTEGAISFIAPGETLVFRADSAGVVELLARIRIEHWSPLARSARQHTPHLE
jgi:hypothetical protein